MKWHEVPREDLQRAMQQPNGDLALMISFLGMLPVPAFVKDKAGRLLYLNPRAELWASIRSQDAIGKTIAEIFSTTDPEIVKAHDRNVLKYSVARVHVHLEAGSPLLTAFEFPFEDSEGDRLIGGILFSSDVAHV